MKTQTIHNPIGAPITAAAEIAAKVGNMKALGVDPPYYITIHIKEMNGIKDYVGEKTSAAKKAGDEILDQLLRATYSSTSAAV